ncbi:hypothetical protein SB768_08120 [Burkholderia sp. SIMBA_043]|uniref:phage tail fiber protein n=1 Tax=Burkholderia TaxID=32008 RepID=UPI0005D8ABBD|nr:hypothetical protein [Burkholderia vietnamiensis]AJY07963.1 hypothetical protein AK36_2028 [Burkholderia vietnamiensis LMG 10929]UBI27569.1 hypothetical protein LA325_15415 [Burkholderia vietnamiensis]
MALSATIEQAILKHFLGVQAYTMPTTVYVALFTTTPTMPAGAGGVEVSGGAYARQPITWTVTGSGPATANNSALVTFPTATANWGTIMGAGIYDSLTGGTLIDAGPLQVSKIIGTGDVFAFPAANYTINQS